MLSTNMSFDTKDFWGCEVWGNNEQPAFSPLSMNNSWGDTERHRRLQSGGSPLLPSHEATLNGFGGGDCNSNFLPSSCQAPVTSEDLNSALKFLTDCNDSPSKESELLENFFSQCNDVQQDFMQGSRNEGHFLTSDTPASYAGQSVGYNPSSSVDPSSQSPFGLLPHQVVKVGRSVENFVSPDSKTVYNGSYTDWENNIPPNPLSVSSSISADTATPSPQTAVLTPLSSNLSPGSNDTNFSPPNMGAYNKPVHSPMAPSPSLAHHSYPSSPYANLDPLCHMSGAPPCSPMNNGPYVNSLNGVPGRNGLQKQQLAPNSNGVMSLYNPQSHHGPISKSQLDYHNDYNSPYPQDRISPPYSSGYSSKASSRQSTDSMASPSPRGNINFHDNSPRYNPLRTIPPTSVSSPQYQQPNSVGHETPYQHPTNMQPPPSYRPCPSVMSTHSYNPVPSPAVPSNVIESDPYVFPSSEMVDDKGALEMFNSHVDQDTSVLNPYSNYTDNNLRMMNATTPPQSFRSSRPGESRLNRPTIYNRGLVQPPVLYRETMQSEVRSAYYSSTIEPSHLSNHMFEAPKRRGGRRGRRRGGNTGCRGRGRGRGQSYDKDKSVYFPHNIPRANNLFKQEEDLFYNSAPLPPAVEPSEPNNQNVNSILRTQMRRFTEPYGIGLIKTEFTSLITFFNQRRNTRSCTRRESPYVAQYKNFLNHQPTPAPGEVWPSKNFQVKTESKKPPDYCPKITIKLVTSKKSRKKWKCFGGTWDSPLTLTSDEEEVISDSTDEESDNNLLPSHKIKQEIKSDEECSVETSNSSQLNEQQGQKSKTKRNKAIKEEKSVDCSPILSVKEEKDWSEAAPIMIDELEFTETEKLGRNTRTFLPEEAVDMKPNDLSKMQVKSETPQAIDRLKVLRSCDDILKDPKPGPSTREDSPDYASDRYEKFDDSDSDPAWMPSAKSAKAADTSKAFAGPSRKRAAKGGRKVSTKSKRTARRKKAAAPQENVPQKKKRQAKPKAAPPAKKAPAEAAGRGRKATGTDRFLVAKADINLPTPFIWKVDRKSSMLQRFEASEQNGVHLYRSSFTYAAGNQFCVSNYVTADVKALSPDTVQYLGPNLSETAELAFSEMKPAEKTCVEEETFDYIKEDFTVYIQSLLSQDVDSTFLHEIKKFNDEYFLIPIENLEAISERKKGKVLKEIWSEEFKKCIDSYPNVNILDSAIEGINCQACKRAQGDKLLQFYGQAYDRITLEHINSPNPTANQFSVCDNCSTSVSFYNRLHHQKYNLFVECHAKASEVKSNNDNVQSHEDVLKLCLEDTVWIEKIFDEHVQLWKDCEKNS